MKSFCQIIVTTFLIANNFLFAGFPADTLIKTSSGLKKMAELNIGDFVESYESAMIATRPIIAKKSTVMQNFVAIVIDNDVLITSK